MSEENVAAEILEAENYRSTFDGQIAELQNTLNGLQAAIRQEAPKWVMAIFDKIIEATQLRTRATRLAAANEQLMARIIWLERPLVNETGWLEARVAELEAELDNLNAIQRMNEVNSRWGSTQ